jgi:hypothetical protein
MTLAAPQQDPQSATSCPPIAHLQVSVTAVSVGRGNAEVTQAFASPRTIDLMASQSGILQSLGLGPLGAGDAAQLRLSTTDGTVEFASGDTAVLKVPGGASVSASTQVPANAFADLVVPAFDPCTVVHAAGNSGQWLLTGNVSAQLRPLPFSAFQIVAGALLPLPGGGFAMLQTNGSGTFVVQRFDSFGNALGGPVTITLPLGAGGSSPSLTLLASGYLGTWLGPVLNPQQPQANDFPLFAQLFDASGQAIAAPVQVAVTTPSISRELPSSVPRAAALPDGGAALVWVQAQPGGTLNVFLQRFSATGLVGSPRQVNVTNGQGLPNVVGQDNGNVLVVWGAGTLSARVFAPDGTAGPEQTIATNAASFSGAPVLSPAPGGGAAVVWESQIVSGVVFIERIGPDGAPVAAPQGVTGVPTPPAAGQHAASVGVLTDGSAVVAWIEGPAQVLARRFAADGTPLGAAQVIEGSHAGSAVVVPLSWGGFIIESSTSGGMVARLFDARALLG